MLLARLSSANASGIPAPEETSSPANTSTAMRIRLAASPYTHLMIGGSISVFAMTFGTGASQMASFLFPALFRDFEIK